MHQGRFPGSGAAQDGKGGAGLDGEMDIFENRHQPFVGKIDVVKHDVSMEVGSQPGRIVLLLLDVYKRQEYRLASEVLTKRIKFSLVCLIIRSPRFFRQSCMTVTVIGTLARIIQKLNCMRPWSNTQTIRLNLEI